MKDKEKKKQKHMKFTTVGELASRLLNHLIHHGVPAAVAERRVAIYYNLGGCRDK